MRTPCVKRRLRLAALALLAAFLLSGCYVSPVDIDVDDLPIGSQGGFQVLPSASPTVTHSSVALPSASAQISIPVITNAPTIMPTASVTYTALQVGSSGAEVTALQQKLIELGYLSGAADGIYGNATQAAVIAFQKAVSLVADGTANSVTQAALFSATAAVMLTPSPSAATSTVLKLGSTGADVRAVQTRLKALKYLTGSADGDFGAATETAVKAFQQNNGLRADGVVGAETLAKLNSSSAISMKEATAAQSLKLGSSGDAVRAVQARLKSLGYYSGSSDGDFGTGTEAAVKAFQKNSGITADGVVGSVTLAKLNSSSAKRAETAATATPRVSERIYLKSGSSGSDVSTMQKRLLSLGYLVGTATGEFDYGTLLGVEAFQDRNMPYTDGIAGPSTLTTLYSSSAKSTSTPAGVIGVTVKSGMSGSAVKVLQRALKNLGYYSGSVDGEFGSTTESAVKTFQSTNNLRADGEAGRSTLNLIFSGNAKSFSGSATATPRSGRVTPTPAGLQGDYRIVTPPPNDVYVTLRQWDGGDLVRELQQELINQGYYNGIADGCYGQGTVDAVKAFQRDKGLEDDGVAGPATQRRLFEGDFPATS